MRIGVALGALLLAAVLGAQDMDGPSAWEVYQEGRAAEKAGHIAEAYLLYMQASAMDPQNRTYWLRGQTLESRALQEVKPTPIPPAPGGALAQAEAPPERFESPTPADWMEVRQLAPPAELTAPSGTSDFDLTGDYKKLFEQLAKAYGLDCIFDPDYLPGKEFRFRVKDVDFRLAMHALEMATDSFVIPLTPKLFMVAKDTAQKRTQLEPVEAVEIRLPETRSSQDFSALIAAVQQSMGLEKVSWDTQTNTVIIRDKVSKVVPAQALFEQLMHPSAQIMIEMQFLTVSRDDTITYGVDFPINFSITPLTSWLGNTPSFPSGIVGLLGFGAGKSLFGIGIMTPSMVAQMTKNTSQVLFDTQLRALDGQPASLHMGQRYPILTSGYFGTQGAANATTQPGTYIPTPSFSFEDLGLTLKVTPTVHDLDTVTLDIDAQYKVLAGTALNGIPVIGSQALKSQTSLRWGEWAMVAGLLDTSDTRTISGIPVLANIPLLGPLTSTHEHDRNDQEVLILLRPQLLSLPPTQYIRRAIDLGPDQRPLTPL